MNLARAIHARWAALENLNRLLSADRVTSGTHAQTASEQAGAVVLLTGGTIDSHFNDGTLLASLLVRIVVRHPECGAGRAIVAAAWQGFDRAELPLDGGSKVICMQPAAAPSETQDPRTRLWQWVLDFECLAHLLIPT